MAQPRLVGIQPASVSNIHPDGMSAEGFAPSEEDLRMIQALDNKNGETPMRQGQVPPHHGVDQSPTSEVLNDVLGPVENNNNENKFVDHR